MTDIAVLTNAPAPSQVLGCIGEQFTEGDEVCGIAVNIRPKGDRIELWTRTASNEAAQTSIGKELKQFLDIPDQMKLGYSVFVSDNTAAVHVLCGIPMHVISG